MPKPKKRPQNRGKNKMKMFQPARPEQTPTPDIYDPQKRKLDSDTSREFASKKSKKASTGDSKTARLISALPLPRPKPSFTTLPPETIQQIFKYTNHISGACLALTCKYMFENGGKYQVSCPPVHGKYSQDRDRLAFMKLLKDFMPEDYRLCWICREYKPINGGQLILYEYAGVPNKKKTSKPPKGECNYEKSKEKWKDDDWTFVSIGACKSKDRKINTRTNCPRCTAQSHNISLQ